MFSKTFTDTVTVRQPQSSGFWSMDDIDYRLPFLFPRPRLQRVINSLRPRDRVQVTYKITGGDKEISLSGVMTVATLVDITVLR